MIFRGRTSNVVFGEAVLGFERVSRCEITGALDVVCVEDHEADRECEQHDRGDGDD